VKPETAKASYRDGVLRVTAARAKIQAGRSVKIE
jgi:HSP20 family molecular chaperone IbpA